MEEKSQEDLIVIQKKVEEHLKVIFIKTILMERVKAIYLDGKGLQGQVGRKETYGQNALQNQRHPSQS